jgi:Sec-independent protein translocase protein TatA
MFEGPKELPDSGRGIGNGIRGLKSATKEHGDSLSPKEL